LPAIVEVAAGKHPPAKAPMTCKITLAAIPLLLLPVAAMAQHSGTPEEQRACSTNVRAFCRPVLDQGDFAVLACLQQHRDKLSPSCKKVLTDHGQ
jgi:hypothetical protein